MAVRIAKPAEEQRNRIFVILTLALAQRPPQVCRFDANACRLRKGAAWPCLELCDQGRVLNMAALAQQPGCLEHILVVWRRSFEERERERVCARAQGEGQRVELGWQ